MDRQEKIYAGPMNLGDGAPVYGEVWFSDETAVFFASGGGQLLTLDSAELSLTGAGLLSIAGTLADADTTWVATVPAAVTQSFTRTKVAFAEGGPMWDGATVTATQYEVKIQLRGETTRHYPGARLRQLNTAQAEVLLADGGMLAVALNTKRGCGCAG